MRQQDTNANNTSGERRPLRWHAVILLTLMAAGVCGVLAGNWWADRRAAYEEGRRVDEHLGLGTRTGLTGDLALEVEPVSLRTVSGGEVKVTLTLRNTGRKPLVLSSWLTPAPRDFSGNQLPLKVAVTRDGHRVAYQGQAVLHPPHEKKDFITLRPGERKSISVDLSRGPDNGRWDTSVPGNYSYEVWYETYLSGRYVGVNAWTGMTNHVIVKAAVYLADRRSN